MLRTMPPRTAIDAETEAAKALSTSMGISSGAARSYTARDLPGVDEVTMFQCSIHLVSTSERGDDQGRSIDNGDIISNTGGAIMNAGQFKGKWMQFKVELKKQ